ncbi:MAG: maleylpyruvate isomerase family mycothiol-dependent enzyme [Streptosporangiaceae bacterium]
MDYFPVIAAERRAIADMLEGLSPQQWETQSLCAGWRVRHVAAHLSVVLTHGMGTLLLAAIRAGGNLDRANRIIVAREAARPIPDIVGDLRANADSRFTPPTFGSDAPLTEVLLHGEDMRVPLGIADGRPAERWHGALDLLLSPKGRRGFAAKGLPPLRYVATDTEWAYGRGDEVRGPAVALALTISGRPARLGELSGPGLANVRAWAGV